MDLNYSDRLVKVYQKPNRASCMVTAVTGQVRGTFWSYKKKKISNCEFSP